MLAPDKYYKVIEQTTLTSVDLLFICDNQVLLGKRNNNPAKGFLFNPGARTYKMETQDQAIRRIAKTECGLLVDNYSLVGVYDHVYENNFKDDKIKTHYVSTCYKIELKIKLFAQPDNQHDKFYWIDIKKALQMENVHVHVKWFLKDIL